MVLDVQPGSSAWEMGGTHGERSWSRGCHDGMTCSTAGVGLILVVNPASGRNGLPYAGANPGNILAPDWSPLAAGTGPVPAAGAADAPPCTPLASLIPLSGAGTASIPAPPRSPALAGTAYAPCPALESGSDSDPAPAPASPDATDSRPVAGNGRHPVVWARSGPRARWRLT